MWESGESGGVVFRRVGSGEVGIERIVLKRTNKMHGLGVCQYVCLLLLRVANSHFADTQAEESSLSPGTSVI